jgi:signal transduction histidine kinase
MLDDLGLIPALQWQAREVSRQTNIDISVETDLTSDDLPDDYKTCIYRVVQEALHNCASHSHASAVRIRVSEESGHLVLLIGDNGTGFDVKHSKGLGMLGMEERVTHLGGRFHISSEPGSGTTLSIDLPYSGDQRTETRERHSYPAG